MGKNKAAAEAEANLFWDKVIEEATKQSAEDNAKAKLNLEGKATLLILGAAALTVAVPYLINKFKKKDD